MIGKSTKESYAVALYDMSIADVKERFEKRQVFPRAVMAANFLGIQPHVLYTRIGNKKNYLYHSETKQKYAIRKLPKNEKI